MGALRYLLGRLVCLTRGHEWCAYYNEWACWRCQGVIHSTWEMKPGDKILAGSKRKAYPR